NGGNLGESGCVSYLFDRKGYLAIERSGLDANEDELLLQAIEAGAEDMETSEEVFEIYTEPENFMAVKESLENEGFEFATAEVTMVPQTDAELDEEQQEKLEKLIDMLEDDDDVQDVYHN